MEASVLLEIIKDDIKILHNQALDLTTDSNLTSDEVEIVLARARNVIKELELLQAKVTVKNVSPKGFVPTENPETSEEKLPETKTEETFSPKVTPLEELPKEKEPEGPESEPPVQEIQEMARPETKVQEMDLLEVEPEEKGKTLGESVATQRSLNDLIGDEKQEDSYMQRPLKSIRDGISLNDRYLFVRELFENNNEKFNEAVHSLDQSADIQEAVHYLKSHFKWSKSDTSQKFLTLVKRRFSN